MSAMLQMIHNPFAMKKPDGSLMVFEYQKDAYYAALKRLYLLFPGGFVDVPLFLSELQVIGIRDAARRCGLKEYAIVPNFYKVNDTDRNNMLRKVMQVAIKSARQDFDYNAMNTALNKLDIEIIEGRIIKNKDIIKVTLV